MTRWENALASGIKARATWHGVQTIQVRTTLHCDSDTNVVLRLAERRAVVLATCSPIALLACGRRSTRTWPSKATIRVWMTRITAHNRLTSCFCSVDARARQGPVDDVHERHVHRFDRRHQAAAKQRRLDFGKCSYPSSLVFRADQARVVRFQTWRLQLYEAQSFGAVREQNERKDRAGSR